MFGSLNMSCPVFKPVSVVERMMCWPRTPLRQTGRAARLVSAGSDERHPSCITHWLLLLQMVGADHSWTQ